MAKEPIGLGRHTVKLEPYNERWADLFEAERLRLKAVLGDDVDVQHIGSTAVPGLKAKPILDIGVGIEDFDAAFAFVKPLEVLGYTFRGEHGIPRRHYFVKGPDNNRTHHLHVLERTHSQWHDMIFFRDYLRTHPKIAAEYQRLKLELAQQFPHDREAYTDGKHTFVQNILNRAE